MKEKSLSTTEQILEQPYVTARDLQKLIPKLGYIRALEYIDIVRSEMEEKGLFVPDGRTKVALTKIVRKKFGI